MVSKITRKKVAVVLFNLGGPLSQEGVYDFLKNLFSDPSILKVPGFIRPFLARIIAKSRTKKAQAIYKQLGGYSPLLENTYQQAKALESYLWNDDKDVVYKAIIAMRYAPPMAENAIEKLELFNPDEIVYIPLYPQFSTTTTGSSFKQMDFLVEKSSVLRCKTVKKLCCYPTLEGFIVSQAEKIVKVLDSMPGKHKKNLRILYSAHGLPEKIVKTGDPYPCQLSLTMEAINSYLSEKYGSFDSVLCYQSKVGPIEWLKPSTEDEIKRANKDGCSVLLVPFSFVSEHSETLVELDIDYAKLAKDMGMNGYYRVETVQNAPKFMASLADKIKSMVVHSEETVTNCKKIVFCKFKDAKVCPFFQNKKLVG